MTIKLALVTLILSLFLSLGSGTLTAKPVMEEASIATLEMEVMPLQQPVPGAVQNVQVNALNPRTTVLKRTLLCAGLLGGFFYGMRKFCESFNASGNYKDLFLLASLGCNAGFCYNLGLLTQGK